MPSPAALLAGIGAGLAMSAARAALQPLGLRPVLVMTDIWRGLLRLRGTRTAFGVHLGVSALVGLLYAFGFRILRVRPSPGLGAVGGVLHWLAASLFVAVVRPSTPKYPDASRDPVRSCCGSGSLTRRRFSSTTWCTA